MKPPVEPPEPGFAAEGGESWLPIPTCEIPYPILEGAPEALGEGAGELEAAAAGTDIGGAAGVASTDRARGAELPRILRQAAGSGRAGGRVLLLMGLLGVLALFEAVLLVQMPSPQPLVVYVDSPRVPLLQAGGALK